MKLSLAFVNYFNPPHPGPLLYFLCLSSAMQLLTVHCPDSNTTELTGHS